MPEINFSLNTIVRSCPICQSSVIQPFMHHGKLAYTICSDCGLVFQNPRMDEAQIQRWYDGQNYMLSVYRHLQPSENKMRIEYRRSHDLIGYIRRFTFTAWKTHLDVGTAMGFLPAMTKDKFETESYAVEPSETLRGCAERMGVKMWAKLEDVDRRFDLVTASHVLEHVPDPVKFLLMLRAHTKSSGMMVVEVPNLYGHIIAEPAHLNAFGTETLRSILEHTGWTIMDLSGDRGMFSDQFGWLLPATNLRAACIPGPRRKVLSVAKWVPAKRRLGMMWSHFGHNLIIPLQLRSLY